MLLASVPAVPPRSNSVEIHFYVGQSETFLPGGRSVGKQQVLVERILDEADGKIVERVISPDYRHPGRYNEFVVTMAVDAAAGTLTQTERNKAFVGTGVLKGEPWHWTAWHTTSTLAGGGKVDSEDRLTSTGMADDKTVDAPDGRHQVTQKEAFTEVNPAEFERIYYGWMLD
jgi:hypothetical protein